MLIWPDLGEKLICEGLHDGKYIIRCWRCWYLCDYFNDEMVIGLSTWIYQFSSEELRVLNCFSGRQATFTPPPIQLQTKEPAFQGRSRASLPSIRGTCSSTGRKTSTKGQTEERSHTLAREGEGGSHTSTREERKELDVRKRRKEGDTSHSMRRREREDLDSPSQNVMCDCFMGAGVCLRRRKPLAPIIDFLIHSYFQSVNLSSEIKMAALNPRATGRFVSGVAKHVSISSDGIRRVAQEIVRITREKKVVLNSSAGPDNLLPKPTEETAVDFLFVSDVLNFCFWPDKDKPKWIVKWNGKSFTGYYALCAALRKAQEEKIPITDPKYYSGISEEDLGRILRPEPHASQVPLLKERVAALRQAGSALIEKYEGTFNKCVKEANKSAEKLLSLIVKDFTSFCDEAEYQGKKVALYKRAQILVGDIWMLFGGKDVGEFHDIESLTAFADYRVPQVLVYFGAMKYTDSLMDTLSKDIQLTNGSPEEVEIRACTIRACELISEELKEMAKQDPTSPVLNDAEVDHFLWNYRRDYAEELEKIPFHKSRCIYY